TIKLFTNFQYAPKEERRGQRAEARAEIKTEQIMRRLVELGIVEEKDGLKIWDKEKLQEIKIGGPKEGSKYQEGFLGVPGQIYRKQFFDFLKNEIGVLREEYDEAKMAGQKALKQLAPHPVFYYPNNLDEAFSPEMIKSRANTVGYWEIGQLVSWSEKIELGSGENVGLNEMMLAKKIYGDLSGRRDENGILNVTGEDGISAPVNAQKLRRWVGQLNTRMDGANESLLTSRPVEYVAKTCPELKKRGLLLPSDFRAVSGWQKEVGKTISPISSGDMISIESQRFYVKDLIDDSRPDDFGGVKLSDGVYAVVERKPSGQWEIFATCKPEKSNASKYHKKEGAQFNPYKITEENTQLPNESAEQYAERIRQMADFSFVAQTAADIAAQTETPIKDNLSWREQQWLATSLHERPKNKEAVIRATKKFGADFLRTFLSCEYDVENASKILKLADELGPNQAQALFKKYGEITQLAENLDQTLSAMTDRHVGLEQRREIRENILRRAKNLLEETADHPEKRAELAQKLGDIHSDTIAFCSLFRSLFKGEAKIDINDLKGLELDTTKVDALRDQDKSEMLTIAKANWSPRGKAGEGVINEFGETLKHGKDIDFYVLRRDGKIISFVRFDAPTPEGHRYAGSFNVDQQYRGSAVGEAMIYNALDKQAEQYVLDATVYPKLDVGTKYVEQTGFAITNV
ncbi:MAG: GNAT family N-acetyltransferase, partial [Candidatus Falkowbacteria bacterium]